jgi:hypothetical protein
MAIHEVARGSEAGATATGGAWTSGAPHLRHAPRSARITAPHAGQLTASALTALPAT